MCTPSLLWRKQLHAFISRSSHTGLFWKIGLMFLTTEKWYKVATIKLGKFIEKDAASIFRGLSPRFSEPFKHKIAQLQMAPSKFDLEPS